MALALVRPDVLYAWKGASLLVVNTKGACGPGHQLSGFYFREARFLRTLALEVNGEAPWSCEAAWVAPDTLAFNLVHPEIKEPGGGGTGQSDDAVTLDAHGLPERSLDLRLTYTVGIASLDILLQIANRARCELRFDLGLRLDADFADIQEAQAGRRQQQAPVERSVHDRRLHLTYAHPRLPYRTEVRDSGGWALSAERACAQVALQPGATADLQLRIAARTGRDDVTHAGAAERERALRAWCETFTRVEAPGNRLFERAVEMNVRDIASFPLLEGEPDEWLSTQAGLPLYPAFFGRDAVTAGWQAASLDRGEALAAALTKLGRLQTDRTDDWRDEQPGRIPYQVRSGLLAALDVTPYAAYYADQASPLMFVISLANLWAWTGERRHVERHWDTARRVLDWAREYGDSDRDGYLEYRTRSSTGAKNQGWKDLSLIHI